jgi:CRP-like cAMP-binding protein
VCAHTFTHCPGVTLKMADFLDEKRKEIQARLRELQPLVEEYRLLEAADAALTGIGNSASLAAAPSAAAPARRKRSTSSRSSGRRGRPRGSGTRAAQALDLVRTRPGITIPEMAQAMGIQQNYLYRVMPGLAEQGKVTKAGKGWHLREGAA